MSRLPFAPLLLAGTALVGGCFDLSSPNTGSLRLSPILDSMFVGDTLSPRTVTFYDANGTPQSPGVVKWHITLDSVGGVPNPVATIDSVTGKIVGRRRGATVVYAEAQHQLAPALITVRAGSNRRRPWTTWSSLRAIPSTFPLPSCSRPGA